MNLAHAMTARVLEARGTEFHLRYSIQNGEPWFVAKDVLSQLGFTGNKGSDNLRSLDDDEKGVCKIDTPGGRQSVAAINESGLYALIFQSRKPEAKAFRRWVTGEVLPTLRREGRYQMHALDQARVAEVKLEVEQTKRILEKKENHYWTVQYVPGNVSIKCYVRAVGLTLTCYQTMGLGSILKHRAKGYGYATGRVRQRRARNGDGSNEDCSGWQTVGTFPPTEIHSELIRRGWLDPRTAVASPERIAEEEARLYKRLPRNLPETSSVETPASHQLPAQAAFALY